jgi:hypothetical protein
MEPMARYIHTDIRSEFCDHHAKLLILLEKLLSELLPFLKKKSTRAPESVH